MARCVIDSPHQAFIGHTFVRMWWPPARCYWVSTVGGASALDRRDLFATHIYRCNTAGIQHIDAPVLYQQEYSDPSAAMEGHSKIVALLAGGQLRPEVFAAAQSEMELQRWLHLRAIEWAHWPAFLSQPIVPLLVIFYPWQWVLVVLFCTEIIWSFLAYSVVNINLSILAAWFVVIFKWPAALICTIVLIIQARYALCAVSLLWPFLAAFISGPITIAWGLSGKPREIGKIETALAKRVGYINHDGLFASF